MAASTEAAHSHRLKAATVSATQCDNLGGSLSSKQCHHGRVRLRTPSACQLYVPLVLANSTAVYTLCVHIVCTHV